MDLTICVMLPPRGASDYSVAANPKYRVLAPVAVYFMGDTSQPVAAECTGYIHVTGVPTPAGWASLTSEEVRARLNAILCRIWENVDGSQRERRLWGGVATSIPQAKRNALLTDRQISVTWTQFKNAIQNLSTSQNLADADLA